jgi:hypothetical protein
VDWQIFTFHSDWNLYAMRVALLTSFAAGRKEPLVAMMDRVRQGFLDSGLPEPFVRFNFAGWYGGVFFVRRSCTEASP